MTFKLDDEIKGLFLLILAITGNFIGETLSCKTQKLLSENMIIKQVFIVFMIFFALSFTSSKIVSPTEHIKKAFFVWCFYILFTKMNLNVTIITFLVLLAIYILEQHRIYYEKTQKGGNQKERIEHLEDIKQKMTKLVIGLVIYGFIIYFMKQYSDHKKDFSMLKFLFGVRQCASLH